LPSGFEVAAGITGSYTANSDPFLPLPTKAAAKPVSAINALGLVHQAKASFGKRQNLITINSKFVPYIQETSNQSSRAKKKKEGKRRAPCSPFYKV
jgi:hypothetical protein